METAALTLIGITFVAAAVNGALGYGFSSLTVPIALLFFTNRVLNPALVLIEVALNTYVLFINRGGLPHVWRRVLPILAGLIPGVLIGSLLLSHVAPGTIKLITYAILLPLILLQASGFRRPLRSERGIGFPFGTGLGVLYSLTTISGPPLALLFNNQGYVRQEFRAGLALVRIVESSLTATAYVFLGLYSIESASLLFLMIPSVLIGIPFGAFFIRRIEAETFRRICMSFDAWVVGFGLSRTLIELNVAEAPAAYLVLVAVALIDAALLVRFFRRRSEVARGVAVPGQASISFH